jgi:NADPH:quinone reductase-like Zn-dependent oxidoreductase
MSRAYGFTSYGGPETETWFDRPQPVPGSSELVIKVKAAGVNPADYKIRSGAMANPQATPNFPLVLGVEAAGVVVAVGSDVEGFAQGDDVMGRTAPEQGSYAEHVSIADPSVTELGGSFLQSSFAGVPAVANLVAAGKVDPKVLQTYPFDQAPQALRAVESGHTLGKIVIDLQQATQV